MVRAQGGDKQAYAVLLQQSGQWLKRYFRRRIAADRLDDLVQETLISLHAKRASYEPARAFLPWLAAIGRYRWIDMLRKDYRTAAASWSEDTGQDGHEDVVAARVSLDRLFALLPAAQVEAIQLVRIEGLSIAEASIRTGQSQSLVKVNIHRGLRRLSAYIESE